MELIMDTTELRRGTVDVLPRPTTPVSTKQAVPVSKGQDVRTPFFSFSFRDHFPKASENLSFTLNSNTISDMFTVSFVFYHRSRHVSCKYDKNLPQPLDILTKFSHQKHGPTHHGHGRAPAPAAGGGRGGWPGEALQPGREGTRGQRREANCKVSTACSFKEHTQTLHVWYTLGWFEGSM